MILPNRAYGYPFFIAGQWQGLPFSLGHVSVLGEKCKCLVSDDNMQWFLSGTPGILGHMHAQHDVARLRSFISSVILPSSLSYVPCTVLKFRALDRFPGRNVLGIFYSRNFLNWVLTALFHPLANV